VRAHLASTARFPEERRGSVSTRATRKSGGDEAAIRAIHRHLIDAWNEGSGRDFAAPFVEDADFVVFETWP
jgi:hypothetical protein